MSGQSVGIVLANDRSRPLEFWVKLDVAARVQLDELVAVDVDNPFNPERPVTVYAVVDDLVDSVEGLTFPGDTELLEQGASYGRRILMAHARVLRFTPDVLRPPRPGAPVRLAAGDDLVKALYVDRMRDAALPVGVLRNGHPAYVNYDFLCGVAGGHVNISGISGVATKTSFATWLLYSVMNARRPDGQFVADDRQHVKAVVFNVKGTDLLYLDKPNARCREDEAAFCREAGLDAASRYELLGLPAQPFERVACRLPPRAGLAGAEHLGCATPAGAVATPYAWSLLEFCRQGMLPYLFALDPGSQMVQFVTEDVTERLKHYAAGQHGPHVLLPAGESAADWDGEAARATVPGLESDGRVKVTTLDELADHVADMLLGGHWARNQQQGTLQAFVRRFRGALKHVRHLVRGDLPPQEFEAARLDPLGSSDMVHVIDIHDLHSVAQAFVVGVVLRDVFERREASGRSAGTVYIVLDELNKYAPAEGESPIKETLLDIAERGRSLGVILIGAQQTASEVERRVVGNAAVRVVGRLDMAEAARPEYRFLPSTLQERAGILSPGSMIVHQPDLPVPLLVTFPFPAWATRHSEVARDAAAGTAAFDDLIALE